MRILKYSESIENWIKNNRNIYSLKEEPVSIKTWEWLMFIFGCYLKEIIQVLIATFGGSKGWSSLEINPFDRDLFWTLIFKSIIGMALLGYFCKKYWGQFFLWYIVIYWIFAVENSLLGIFVKSGSIFKELALISGLLLQFFTFFYFFRLDNNIDLLKILLYDNLEYDEINNKIYKTPWSKISKKKLEGLGTAIMQAIFITFVVFTTINWFWGLFKENNEIIREINPKNQENIQEMAKKNLGWVAFSSVIIAPITEELIFRKCLMKLGNYRWSSVLISGFIFGLIHLHSEPLHVILPYLIPGLSFAFLNYIFKNVWFSVFCHGIHNTFALIMTIVKLF